MDASFANAIEDVAEEGGLQLFNFVHNQKIDIDYYILAEW